ncbi:hypothetical protein FD755_014383 [Muntiacus reevesi]|uniref:NADP-dependent oxidoreductase domain-containing protein n=1 Tax=Muntiacus reevesi TaxID=9886 RepID=A0A5N3XLM9_MUNRE|nr:hypothetical protein FD755_014383 [Muntiacus reevesi]
MQETWVQSLSWEDLPEEGKVTHSSVLAWRIPMDRGAWWTTVHGVARSRTRLSDKGQHSIWGEDAGGLLGPAFLTGSQGLRLQRNGPQLKCLGTVPSRLSLTSYLDFTWLEFIEMCYAGLLLTYHYPVISARHHPSVSQTSLFLACAKKDPDSSSQTELQGSILGSQIVRAMTHVINQGMAMYWGTSRWSAMEIMEAYSVARQFNMIPPVCEQAEYHLFQREKVEVQLPELYHKIGVGAMTWSPLACGIISGKYGNGVPESSRASLKCYQWLKERIVSEEGRKQQNKLKDLSPIAERLGCTLPQLAVAWCLRNEGVSSVLLGSSTPEQLIENLGAIQVLPKMTSHVVNEIDNILRNKPYSKKDYRS